MPYHRKQQIEFSEFGRDIFLVDHFGPAVKDKVWPVLIALSKIGLERMPDLSTYLPPPTDPSYPEQCLGLQLLLDVCPRVLFRGIDSRWTYAYFDRIAQRLAMIWHSLPAEQQPDSWDRWKTDTALDYWIGIRFWFGTPFVHSENWEHQKIAVAFTEETRCVVEWVTGQTDPYRAKRDEILSDLVGFPREYRKGPPQGEDVTRESWAFWMGMLMDIHQPIINHFGRYPYLNAIQGRVSTAEEEEWIEKTGHFQEPNADVARRVKEDIRTGRWTPLGTDSLG
jgi:uncharacterized protein (DUF924 family)